MGLLPEGAQVEGSIRLLGQELVGLDDAAMSRLRGDRVAMVFQEPMTALNPLHRIGDQVAEPLRLHRRLDRAAARAEALRLLERVRLPQAARLVHRERRLARRRMQARRVEPWHVRVLRIHELLRSSCALSERRGAADQHGHVPECTHQLHAVQRGHPLVPRSRLRPRPHVGRPTLGAGDGYVRLQAVTYGHVR